MQNDLIDRLVDEGKVDKVANVIGDDAPSPPSEAPFVLPVLGNYPQSFPGTGIYFNMPDEVYHAIPALSCSGIKMVASSPMLFWARTKWLNEELLPDPEAEQDEEKEKLHLSIGKAYHARILEGKQPFLDRFCVGLDKKAIPGLCVTIDDIKKRINEVHDKVPFGKQKADFVKQLLELEPDAPIWEELQRKHAEANIGKVSLPLEVVVRIETAAMTIENSYLKPYVTNGHPEVSLFWIDEHGIPMKCRVDRLLIKAMVDLKSFENKFQLSPERAIAKDIANNKYVIQPVVYFEGAQAVREAVRKHGASVVYDWHDDVGVKPATGELQAWALKWAKHALPDQWVWIFQQKGVAPITRGIQFPRGGSHHLAADGIVSAAKRNFRLYATTYGTDPWLDMGAELYQMPDEEIPNYATDI